MTGSARRVGRLVGELALLGILHVVYGWIHRYDWGQPFTKLICYGVLFALVLLADSDRPTLSLGVLARAELVILIATLALIPAGHGRHYGRHLLEPPRVDIGTTTEQAASTFLREGQNPYGSDRVFARPDIARRFPGYHYGPVMFLGYAPSVFSSTLGFKLTSVAYLAGTLLILATLLWVHAGPTGLGRVSAVLFFLVATLLPERLWYELLRQGATDILPVFLLALALYGVHAERWFGAGLCLGLSLSAKISPALFLLVVLVRRRTPRALYTGVILGLTPVLAFLLWDFRSAVDGIFLVLLAMQYDSTSLYSITPRALHFIFPLAQIAAVVVTLSRNFERPLTEAGVLRSFLLLTIVQMVCHKEIHTNHLLWVLPFLGYVLATHRFLASGALTRILGVVRKVPAPE